MPLISPYVGLYIRQRVCIALPVLYDDVTNVDEYLIAQRILPWTNIQDFTSLLVHDLIFSNLPSS